MKGSVYKLKSSSGRVSWRYQLDAGRDENGNRIRLGESGFRLEREADDALRKKIQELRGCVFSTADTLGQYTESWLPYHTKTKPLAPKTAERY